jgi:hypothetical protein
MTNMKKVVDQEQVSQISVKQICNQDYILGKVFILTNGRIIYILRHEPEIGNNRGGFIFRSMNQPCGHLGVYASVQDAINDRCPGWDCYVFENMQEFIQALTPDFKLKGI